jgi:hypothetical protein
MPPAKKPVSQSALRPPVTFTEPAALKHLTTKSLGRGYFATTRNRL